jgi:hypothetical protein
MKLYVNRDVDFETWDRTHTIDMPDAGSDEAEFPLSLSLFVHSNFGGAVARLQYVGLKGTFLAPKVCSNSPSLSHPSPPPLSPLLTMCLCCRSGLAPSRTRCTRPSRSCRVRDAAHECHVAAFTTRAALCDAPADHKLKDEAAGFSMGAAVMQQLARGQAFGT